MTSPTYNRPVKAKMVIRLSNGEEWEAQEEDFDKFGLVNGCEAYERFCDKLWRALTEHGPLTEGDLTDAAVNPIRHLAEIIFCYPQDFAEHPDMADTYDAIGKIERVLRERVLHESMEPAAAPARDPHDTTDDELRLHLLTEHSNLAALGLSGAEATKHHDHEHSGPGTIRSHEHIDRDWSLRKGLSMIGDIEYDTVIGNDQITDMLGSFHEHIDRISTNPTGHDPIEANH